MLLRQLGRRRFPPLPYANVRESGLQVGGLLAWVPGTCPHAHPFRIVPLWKKVEATESAAGRTYG